MKKFKYQILFTILFMTVGIAAVSTNVLINGSTPIASNPDDFSVYFSDVLVDGEQDLSLIRSDNTLYFDFEFDELGETKTIAYEVTNASKNYDADVDISCNHNVSYLSIVNDFYTSANLAARSSRSGILIVSLNNSYTGADLIQEISCTISASAVERTTQGSGDVSVPLSKYYIGREVSIGEEKFNIISDNGDTVKMFAQYNVGEDIRQSRVEYDVQFSNYGGWEYENEDGPIEINIQDYDGATKTILNDYVDYLKAELYDTSLLGNLITLKELESLGCVIPSDYFWGDGDGWTCNGSEYKEWLVNGQYWWTRSPEGTEVVWHMYGDGFLDTVSYETAYAVRPVITVSKDLCDDLLNDMIFFTIDGVTYKAKNGMTWGEWVESEYNTVGVTLLSKDIYLNGKLLTLLQDCENIYSDSIIDETSYITAGNDCEHLGGSSN